MEKPDFERVYELRRFAADERNMGHMIMAYWSEEDAIELAEDLATGYLDHLGDNFNEARDFVENMPPLVQWLYDRLMKRIDDAEALRSGPSESSSGDGTSNQAGGVVASLEA